MKKAIVIGLLPFFAVLALAQGPGGPGGGPGGGRGFGPGRGFGFGPQKVVTGAPYSGTETRTSVRILANGNQITHTQTISVARDSEGRISTSETITPRAASGKPAFTVESIFDPVAGYRYELDSATMVAIQSKIHIPPAGGGTRPTPPANPNVTTTNLGASVVNNVPVTGTEVTMTIPAGAVGNAQAIVITRVTWVSTALQVPVQIKTSDPRFGTTDMELTNIVQAEPSGSLFVVPAGYAVKTGGRGAGPGGPGAAGHFRGPF